MQNIYEVIRKVLAEFVENAANDIIFDNINELKWLVEGDSNADVLAIEGVEESLCNLNQFNESDSLLIAGAENIEASEEESIKDLVIAHVWELVKEKVEGFAENYKESSQLLLCEADQRKTPESIQAEIELLETWLSNHKMASKSSISVMPCFGDSYIDGRLSYFSNIEATNFVFFENECVRRIPWLKSKSRDEVKTYLNKIKTLFSE